MASNQEYEKRIKNYEWAELRDLWAGIQERHTPDWDPGKAFEYFILRCFELNGATVKYPYEVKNEGTTLEQIDGVIYTEGLVCLVECKDQQQNINFEPIAKLRSQLLRRHSNAIGCLFSTSEYTPQAITLVNFLSPQTILLWRTKEIELCLEEQSFCTSLLTKYRYGVEYATYDFNIIALKD